MDERGTGRRHGAGGFGTAVQKDTHLGGFVRSSLLSPQTIRGQLYGHLHVSIRRKARLFDEITSVALEALDMQIVSANQRVKVISCLDESTEGKC